MKPEMCKLGANFLSGRQFMNSLDENLAAKKSLKKVTHDWRSSKSSESSSTANPSPGTQPDCQIPRLTALRQSSFNSIEVATIEMRKINFEKVSINISRKALPTMDTAFRWLMLIYCREMRQLTTWIQSDVRIAVVLSTLIQCYIT
jgi:hypothetical protein